MLEILSKTKKSANQKKLIEKEELSFNFKSLLSGKNEEKKVFEEPPQVLHLSPFETKYEILDRYWLTPPYAYDNIYRDEYDNVHYQMIEPKLNEKEIVVLE